MTRSRDVADTQDNLGGAVAPFVGAKNIIGNGGLDFWQRGTTFTGTGSGLYTADRWSMTANGTNINTTTTQDTSTPNASIKYAIKYQQVSTASTSVTEWRARQFIEVGVIRPLQGKLVTTSFWYKSNLTGNHAIRLGIYQATGTNLDSLQSFSYPTANVWQYVSVTHSCLVGTTGWTVAENQAGAFLDVGPSQSSYAINDYFEFTNMQLEAGSVATPFTRAGGTYGGELALCQRYYWRTTVSSAYGFLGFGVSTSTTAGRFFITPQVPMRIAPTSVDFPTLSTLRLADAAIASPPTGLTLDGDQTASLFGIVTTGSTGLTQFRPTWFQANNSTSAYLGFSAEL